MKFGIGIGYFLKYHLTKLDGLSAAHCKRDSSWYTESLENNATNLEIIVQTSDSCKNRERYVPLFRCEHTHMVFPLHMLLYTPRMTVVQGLLAFSFLITCFYMSTQVK